MVKTVKALAAATVAIFLQAGIPPTSVAQGRRLPSSKFASLYDALKSGDHKIAMGTLTMSTNGDVIGFELDHRVFVVNNAGRILTVEKGQSPSVAPDGNSVAFWSARSGTRQLWIRSLVRKHAGALTRDARGVEEPLLGRDIYTPRDLQRISWSADSRRIAYAAINAGPTRLGKKQVSRPFFELYSSSDISADPMKTLGEASTYYFQPNAHSRLFVVDVKSGTKRQITSDADNYLSPSWSPDGQRIVAIRRSTEPDIMARPGQRIALLNKAGGLLWLGQDRFVSWPIFSPSGKRIAYTARDSIFAFPHLRFVDDQAERNLAVDGQSGTMEGDYGWTSNDTLASFQRDGLSTLVRKTQISDGHLVGSLRAVNARVYDGTFGPRAEYAVFDDQTSPSSLHSLLAGPTKAIFSTETKPLAHFRPRYIPLSWMNDSGEQVTAMLLLPRGRTTKPRLILDAYPGIASYSFSEDTYRSTGYLVSSGFAVLVVNSRAPHCCCPLKAGQVLAG